MILNWIEIPPHRILPVTRYELMENYSQVDATGEPVPEGAETYRVIREHDKKVFKFARFIPGRSIDADVYFLEEI